MISDYVRRLRACVGHDVLLLPSVALLPFDDEGRLLLVLQADGRRWSTVGGTVELGESPDEAARREASEEIGAEVTLRRLVGCFGGPGFEATYANGDRAAFVTAVYEATIEAEPAADLEEVLETRWFERRELSVVPLTRFTETLLRAIALVD